MLFHFSPIQIQEIPKIIQQKNGEKGGGTLRKGTGGGTGRGNEEIRGKGKGVGVGVGYVRVPSAGKPGVGFENWILQ